MGPVLWPRTTDYLVPGAYLVLLIVTAVHIRIHLHTGAYEYCRDNMQ